MRSKKIFKDFKYCLSFIPDNLYIEVYYFLRMKKRINLKDPQSFNEKLNWLKLYDRKPVYTKLVDKYSVRKFIIETIGEQYLVPLLAGPYNNFEEIDFDSLPNKFVIKCTHDSGGIVICNDKHKFSKDKARKKINDCLKHNYYYIGREWAYKNVKPQIIIEKFLEDKSDDDLKDYKIMVFNGKVKCSFVCSNRSERGVKVTFFDNEWNRLPFERKYPISKENIDKPINFEKMCELAEKISMNIPFARIDFYDVNGRIYFGEITLYPGCGMEPFQPAKWDYILGQWMELPKL